MRRTVKHSHPCQDCGTRTPCDGPLEENYDGEPAIICADFHLPSGSLNRDFICEACQWTREDNAEPPEPDGEAFRGGEAVGYAREQQIAARRLK